VTSPEPGRTWWGATLGAAAVVLLSACVPYLSTVDDYFVQDDFGVVQLMASRPWTMFFRWFTMPWTEDIWMYTPDEIRPFVALSYVMTASWGAAEPAAHHVLNIAIHAGNGLLVMGIARASGLGRTASTFAAVVFVLLPVHAESVAWVTGRVDSMPAFFYLAAFLAYARWTSGRPAAYAWSLLWFFVALFSKQNTITLPAALIAYDFIVLRRPVRPSWSWMRPYVPFVLMTAGFLALRYVVAGTVVRESELNAEGLRIFAGMVVRHTQRVVFGHVSTVHAGEWTAIVLLVAAAGFGLSRVNPAQRRHLVPAAIFFGLAWWVLGVAPVAVAGYESPRHVYLAAMGWALLLGIGLEALSAAAGHTRWKYALGAAAATVLVFYGVQLREVVSRWNTAADVSRRAVARLQREAMAVPPGSLVIVGVPVSSWEWAVPFMAQPPYTRSDLTSRVFIITPWRLHCCRSQWLDHTRKTLEHWMALPEPSPVLALHFDPQTGTMSRLAENEYPGLRSIVQTLLRTDSRDALDHAILRLLDELVAGRPTPRAARPSVRPATHAARGSTRREGSPARALLPPAPAKWGPTDPGRRADLRPIVTPRPPARHRARSRQAAAGQTR
jgi:hypothetical protein